MPIGTFYRSIKLSAGLTEKHLKKSFRPTPIEHFSSTGNRLEELDVDGSRKLDGLRP